jgi:hypothetical protein
MMTGSAAGARSARWQIAFARPGKMMACAGVSEYR